MTYDSLRLTATGIMELLPHRYPFLLIDRILECRPGESITALKNPSDLTGEASWGLVMAHYLRGFKRVPRLDSPHRIFEFAQKLHVHLKEEYFLNPKDDEKSADDRQIKRTRDLFSKGEPPPKPARPVRRAPRPRVVQMQPPPPISQEVEMIRGNKRSVETISNAVN